MSQHEPQEAYDGPATLDGQAVVARLRGHFEPIDGRFHWYGRVRAEHSLPELGTTITLATPYGTAEARLSDPDPWGRLRVTGTGRPPF